MEICKNELGVERACNSTFYFNKGGVVVTYPTDHGEFLQVVLVIQGKKPWEGEAWRKTGQTEAMKKDFAAWGSVANKLVKVRSPKIRRREWH
jgi:hypothetical protein